MRVLQIHNLYLAGEGGEDVALAADRALLLERGHEVEQFLGSNAEFGVARGVRRATLAANSVWSRRSYAALDALVQLRRPTIAHVHNTFGQLSGSVYWALARRGVPVVQTIQNYRWLCPASTLLRDGRPCEECVGRVPVPAILHRCRYGDSFSAAAVIAAANTLHGAIGTYTKRIHAVIALTKFMQSKLVAAGFQPERLHVRPNFLADPGEPTFEYKRRSSQMVFLGQIEAHKGVAMFAQAWSAMAAPGWHLAMVGDGRLRASLSAEWSRRPDIEWTGKLSRDDALMFVSASRFLVLPSLWYEGVPLVLLEAMSRGTPLIVPDHGAFPEIVDHGVNGIVFRAGDEAALGEAIRRAVAMPPAEWERLARGARARFLERFAPQRAYDKLLSVYMSALETAQHHGSAIGKS